MHGMKRNKKRRFFIDHIQSFIHFFLSPSFYTDRMLRSFVFWTRRRLFTLVFSSPIKILIVCDMREENIIKHSFEVCQCLYVLFKILSCHFSSSARNKCHTKDKTAEYKWYISTTTTATRRLVYFLCVLFFIISYVS